MLRFYQRFFPHLLKQVGEGRYVLLNALARPVGIPDAVSRGTTDAAFAFELQLEDHHVRELEALGAKVTMEGIYLFEDSDNPNESGASFTEYANRMQVLSDLMMR